MFLCHIIAVKHNFRVFYILWIKNDRKESENRSIRKNGYTVDYGLSPSTNIALFSMSRNFNFVGFNHNM